MEQLVKILEAVRFPALALVIISLPLFGFLAFGTIMFCDAPGEGAACMKIAFFSLVAPPVQIASLIAAWILLSARKRLRLAAGLMFLSILPPLAVLVFVCETKIASVFHGAH